MNTRNFSDAMSEIESKYIDEALGYRKKGENHIWIKWGTMAACLCLMLVSGFMLLQKGNGAIPNPKKVQIPNPIIEVATVEEMEQYLDFAVPVLDKEMQSCSVLLEDYYPTMGQINYTDGSEFRIKYGSGDISGIFGGTLEESKEINGVMVKYYQYEETSYALWEQNGFTFSYVYTHDGDGDADIELFIRQYQ